MSRLKIVVVGDRNSGKTSLVQKYISGEFNSATRATIQVGVLTTTKEINGKSWEVDIWDTAGQEQYASLSPMYFRNANAVLIVFDITDANSYAHARQLNSQLRFHPMEPIMSSAAFAIAANKKDLDLIRVIAPSELDQFSEAVGVPVYETSAKSGVNVNRMFDSLIAEAASKSAKEASKAPIDPTNTDHHKCC